MNRNIIESIKEIPSALEKSLGMSEANSQIKIHEGKFTLKDNREELKLKGEISLHWLPSPQVLFTGSSEVQGESIFNSFSTEETFSLYFNGLEFGQAIITGVGSEIKGTIINRAVLGERAISVEKVQFSIPNLREFHGHPVKRISGQKYSLSKGRLLLENEKYTVKIDKACNYRDLHNQLKEKGGFIFMYNGELIKKKGPISLNESNEILSCISTFLTFLNGRRTSAMAINGIFDNEIKWSDHTAYHVDPYKYISSWPPIHSINGLNEMWCNFSNIWQNEDDRDFLSSAVHWYIEANSNSGFAEGAIIMAQTALELIYNWWIIEHKKIIVGRDGESISAANKIRLLISQLNIDYSVPSGLGNLARYLKNENQIHDGPDAIVQIRNMIVHSQQDKRKRLIAIHPLAKVEALQLCLWYIELSLLSILNYRDLYYNRTLNEYYRGESVELVPWV